MPNKVAVEEYLTLDQIAGQRTEFYDGIIYNLPITNPAHNLIKSNCSAEIGLAIKGTRSHSYSTTQRISITDMKFYGYPDILVVGGKNEYDHLDENTITNPTLICEVYTEQSAFWDREIKLKVYQSSPTLKEYMLVNSNKMEIQIWRKMDESLWQLFDVQDTVDLYSVGISVRSADIYMKTEL
ncbi:Uma2 family endonuclease [Dyadobacter sp. CY356]|uniref:Uma2 family endonuclease n=1 Tax=Dyadobacter sp. CY356 TaxID=2906442 RepID=UPI001F34357B|nr:Uma2 family endonuclease [Dyadobacter sp. CY356]MCF0057148.1 Uma2 family endonuclease [Dyadobacter sp. CY356]